MEAHETVFKLYRNQSVLCNCIMILIKIASLLNPCSMPPIQQINPILTKEWISYQSTIPMNHNHIVIE